jgi:hypothetical protein
LDVHYPFSAFDGVVFGFVGCFFHALNTKDYLFLYQNVITARVVDQRTFTAGTVEDLIEILKTNKVKIKKKPKNDLANSDFEKIKTASLSNQKARKEAVFHCLWFISFQKPRIE